MKQMPPINPLFITQAYTSLTIKKQCKTAKKFIRHYQTFPSLAAKRIIYFTYYIFVIQKWGKHCLCTMARSLFSFYSIEHKFRNNSRLTIDIRNAPQILIKTIFWFLEYQLFHFLKAVGRITPWLYIQVDFRSKLKSK